MTVTKASLDKAVKQAKPMVLPKIAKKVAR